MIVLSLCDGISCGQLALKNLGIKVDKYYASEIKKHAIKVTMDNFPNTIQLGDVNNISYKDGTIYSEIEEFYEPEIDLVMFGSPCQDLSIANHVRKGLEGEKSSLFFSCYDILKTVNPKYFLMENVFGMKKESKDVITSCLGVEPIFINSADFTGVSRKRYYWTNIPITKPIEKRNVQFQDILTSGYTPRKHGRCVLAGDPISMVSPEKRLGRYLRTGFTNIIFKDKENYDKIMNFWDQTFEKRNIPAKEVNEYFETHEVPDYFYDIRYMNREEYEKTQGLPQGYTKCVSINQAVNCIGDGWTIPVIEYLLSGLKDDN